MWGRVGWECELKMQGVSGESCEAQGGIPGGAPPAPRPRDREYQVFTRNLAKRLCARNVVVVACAARCSRTYRKTASCCFLLAFSRARTSAVLPTCRRTVRPDCARPPAQDPGSFFTKNTVLPYKAGFYIMTDVAGQWMRLHPFSKEKTWVGAEFVQQLKAEMMEAAEEVGLPNGRWQPDGQKPTRNVTTSTPPGSSARPASSTPGPSAPPPTSPPERARKARGAGLSTGCSEKNKATS